MRVDNGPDGNNFDVVQDSRGFIIKCGPKKQTAIRLSSKITEKDIILAYISSTISSYFATRPRLPEFQRSWMMVM